MTEERMPEPGWYPDPFGAPGLRWWDGVSWSDSTHALPDTGAPTVEPAYPAILDGGSDPAASVALSPRRSPVLAIAIGLALTAIVVIAVVALLSAISSRSRLDTAAVEQQIAGDLSVQTGQTTTVQCPDSVALETGVTFTCSAATADGRSGQVEVTQDDESGNVTWRLVG